MKIHAQAARAAKSALSPFDYEAADLGPNDVEIAIAFCGICHSDLHLIDDDWHLSSYPLVPGHEIVGRVEAIGPSVSHLAVGQSVGVGWQRSACLSCSICLAGNENLCSRQTAICVGHHGGMADRIRTDGRFVFALPDGLDPAATAPLFCGGATVFSPLRRFHVDATSSVGVIGIGGLGHIALLFLRALGAEITALSSTPDKRAEAIAMGAHHFASSTDAREIRKHAGRFDLLLSTVNARLDWITLMGTLRPNGVLCLVGSPPGLVAIPAAVLFAGQRSITASEIGSRATIVEMLAFAGRHRIAPRIELAALGDVNAALDRLRKNQVRYRMVLENR